MICPHCGLVACEDCSRYFNAVDEVQRRIDQGEDMTALEMQEEIRRLSE